MRREAALIFSPNGGSAEKAPPSADGSAPQARPSFSLRPKAAFFTPSKRGASQPPILFSREKRTGRWSGPRENAPGAWKPIVLHEARIGPWSPSLLGAGASRKLCGGVGGAFYASGGAVRFLTPDDFSLVPPGGTVSFCKKEMVGPTAPPHGVWVPSSAARGRILRPRPWAELPSGGKWNRGFQSLSPPAAASSLYTRGPYIVRLRRGSIKAASRQ